MFLLRLKFKVFRKSNKSRYQYFPIKVILYIGMASLKGIPQSALYFGKRILNMAGMVTKIQGKVLAYKNAPSFILAFRQTAFARSIFSDLNEAMGNHSSSRRVLFCKSPQTTSIIFNLSKEPSLFILTLLFCMPAKSHYL